MSRIDSILDREFPPAQSRVDAILDAEFSTTGNRPGYIGGVGGRPPNTPAELSAAMQQPGFDPDVAALRMRGLDVGQDGMVDVGNGARMTPRAVLNRFPDAGILEAPDTGAMRNFGTGVRYGFYQAKPGMLKPEQYQFGGPGVGDTPPPPQPGAAGFVGEQVGVMSGGLLDARQLPLMVVSGGAGSEAAALASPLLKRVEAVAGKQVAALLERQIADGVAMGSMSGVHEAAAIPSDQWVADPMGSLARVGKATGIGAATGVVTGTAFGGVNAVRDLASDSVPRGTPEQGISNAKEGRASAGEGGQAQGFDGGPGEGVRLRDDEQGGPVAQQPQAAPAPEPVATHAELIAEARARGLDQTGTTMELRDRLASEANTPPPEASLPPQQSVVPEQQPAIPSPAPESSPVAESPASPESTAPSPESLSPPSARTAENAPEPVSEPVITSARKAMTTQDRETMGLDALDSPQRRSWQTALDDARKQGLHEQHKADALAAEINTNPRALSDTETAGLVQRAAELKNRHAEAVRGIGTESDPAATAFKAAEINRIEQDFDNLTAALRKSGTEKGRALAAQKLTLDQDFTLVSVKSRAKAAKGAELTRIESARFEKMTADLEAANRRVAELESQMHDQIAERAIRARRQQIARMKPADQAADYAAALSRAKELIKQGCH